LSHAKCRSHGPRLRPRRPRTSLCPHQPAPVPACKIIPCPSCNQSGFRRALMPSIRPAVLPRRHLFFMSMTCPPWLCRHLGQVPFSTTLGAHDGRQLKISRLGPGGSPSFAKSRLASLRAKISFACKKQSKSKLERRQASCTKAGADPAQFFVKPATTAYTADRYGTTSAEKPGGFRSSGYVRHCQFSSNETENPRHMPHSSIGLKSAISVCAVLGGPSARSKSLQPPARPGSQLAPMGPTSIEAHGVTQAYAWELACAQADFGIPCKQ